MSRVRRRAPHAARHPVQGRRRHQFYDRREVKDALAYLQAVVNPVDEVSIKRVLNVPKRGVGDSTVGRLDAWANAPTASRSSRRCAGPTTPASSGRAVKGIAEFLDLLDELTEHRGATVRRRCSRRSSTAPGTSPSCRPSTRSRPRAGSRTSPSSSASPASSTTSTSSSSRCRLVADTDELPEGRRDVGRAHDPARGQGARVPVGVPHRHGGRRLPPSPLARRARRARGGAAPRLRRHHPGPRAAVPHQRVEPDAVTASTQYNPPSRFLDEIPTHLVEHAEGSRDDPRTRSGRRRSARAAGRSPIAPQPRRDRRAGAAAERARRRAAPRRSACGSATTSATPSGARASSSTSRARATRPRRPSTSPRSARSACCSAGRRSRRSDRPPCHLRMAAAMSLKALDRARSCCGATRRSARSWSGWPRCTGERRLVEEADGGLQLTYARRRSGSTAGPAASPPGSSRRPCRDRHPERLRACCCCAWRRRGPAASRCR